MRLRGEEPLHLSHTHLMTTPLTSHAAVHNGAKAEESTFSRLERLEEGSPALTGKNVVDLMMALPALHQTDSMDLEAVDVEDRKSYEGLKNITDRLCDILTDVRKNMGQSLDNRTCPDDEAIRNERCRAFSMLSTLPPFSYLPENQRQNLLNDLQVFHYTSGDVIIQHDKRARHVFLMAKGRAMLASVKSHVSLGESPVSFLGYRDAPAYFDEWEPFFEERLKGKVVAGGDVTAYRMDGKRFEKLLSHKAFRLKLAHGMKKNRGVFSEIDSFVAVVRRAVTLEDMDFNAVLSTYRKMTPAIHANLHSPDLDIEGWIYAVRRLPDTVTSAYVYLLSNTVPMPFMDENFDLSEISVPSAARRRSAFALDHGKLLVLMREQFSDVLDFMSLLCAHVHESNKLRVKLTKPEALAAIHKCLWSSERRIGPDSAILSNNAYRHHRRSMYTSVQIEEQMEAMSMLPLTKKEIVGLRSIWPNDPLYRVWDIVALHENIQVLGDFRASYDDAIDRWAESIRRAVIDLFCNKVGEESEERIGDMSDITTHIISSNTTSVRNLLSPYIHKNKEKIIEWGAMACPEIESNGRISECNKLYALSTAYMSSNPEALQEQDEFDSCCFLTLRHTELTGIQVELIDLDALELAYEKLNIKPDPFLASSFHADGKETSCNSGTQRRLLVNIDYAFGKQAEGIISALAMLFGESLASVGVMGKAGGLQGKRGDIIVADYLVDQEANDVTPIDNYGIDREALKSMSRRSLWAGGVLTVLGTLLQDHRLLQYYKKLFNCVSLEMEGSFYAKELMRLKKAQLLSDDLHLRFLYYVSDTPLSKDQNETLSKDLDVSEIVPPLYAVTRELLRLVLSA